MARDAAVISGTVCLLGDADEARRTARGHYARQTGLMPSSNGRAIPITGRVEKDLSRDTDGARIDA
jgi:hypothetical protein